ncbi:aldo/keto reductase [Frigidibacter sp.]|uniref:aldo/keto reductase n=1 Tax=Frigidibacter sp. TaxID=2586418 RepID=UPI002733DF4F|nr:aldo/keto reductase [Frigidibacter sp.]MDP3342731.1 aldo/keto reductase [Frigidibacter sp.]
MTRMTLGDSDISVSALCLGTMTFGTQTDEAGGHAQMDMALDHGVDFWDTAEMYPVNPVSVETIGDTEAIIGSWFAQRGRRDDVVLATKISGKGGKAREGEAISPDSIRRALEASLGRLRTDYVDLYQFHWPNRGSYHFRQIWKFDASKQDRAATRQHMQDCLGTLGELKAEGKIRAFGLSNESAWGMAEWLRLAEASGGPRALAVQNEYSLLCRMYDGDMAELGVNEQVTLLAYSPLATGLLSGKYAPDVTPEGSRRERNGDLGGRITPRVWDAVAAYVDLAAVQGLDPVQMAVAWVMGRPFPVVPIIGATTEAQLERVLGAADMKLAPELLTAIDRIHKAHPMPF